jgi:hypothetical protein
LRLTHQAEDKRAHAQMLEKEAADLEQIASRNRR